MLSLPSFLADLRRGWQQLAFRLKKATAGKAAGEPALVATAPAILNAIHHATGVRMDSVPVTPTRLREALLRQAAREVAE